MCLVRRIMMFREKCRTSAKCLDARYAAINREACLQVQPFSFKRVVALQLVKIKQEIVQEKSSTSTDFRGYNLKKYDYD